MIQILLLLRVIFWEFVLWKRCAALLLAPTEKEHARLKTLARRAMEMVVTAKDDCVAGRVRLRESDSILRLTPDA